MVYEIGLTVWGTFYTHLACPSIHVMTQNGVWEVTHVTYETSNAFFSNRVQTASRIVELLRSIKVNEKKEATESSTETAETDQTATSESTEPDRSKALV